MPVEHTTVVDEQRVAVESPKPPVFDEGDGLERGPYRDGFSMRTVIGALFVAFIMMPGAIYMGLVAGQGLGAAAEWVTIILFAELARRSFVHLSRQEIYVLFYVASGIAAVAIPHLALAGGPFAGAIWNQYLLQSPQTSSIAPHIPDWVVPPLSSAAIQTRNLAHIDWWWSHSRGVFSPILLIAIGSVLGRLSFFGLGYIVFRITSDMERLPFPMAPIAAEGSTALAEATTRDATGVSKTSWRWNVFSIGACLGIVFGAVYILIPAVSGLFLSKPIMVLPIPFVDFTRRIEGIMPASLVSISFDAGLFLAGMILPFAFVSGNFFSVLVTGVLAAPLLLRMGFFKHWTSGNGLLVNQMLLSFDFWMSVTIGFAVAVLLIGLGNLSGTFRRVRQKPAEVQPSVAEDPLYRRASRERGDFSIWIAVTLFLISTACYAGICKVLVPDFPFWIVLIFGFIWTPLNSYISARLIGVSGMGLSTPFLRETAFITSGYRGVDIWFAPIPLADYGGAAQQFRALELTRTRFTSIIKAEFVMFPVIFASSFIFWWFFWKLNQVPSSTFPFAARIWPVAARQAYLIFTANSSGQSLLLQAINLKVIFSAACVGMGLFALLKALRLPTVFFYGLALGLGAPLHGALSMMLGALVSKYYFRKKFGAEKWSRYLPVVIAGFSCGMGLAGMMAVGITLVMQCTRDLPY